MTVMRAFAELVAALAPLRPEHRETLIASVTADSGDGAAEGPSRPAPADQDAAR